MYTGTKDYFRIIEGACFGLGLSERGPQDNVICYTILHEDDENYFESEGGWCAWWLPHHTAFMQECLEILERDYVKTEDGTFINVKKSVE